MLQSLPLVIGALGFVVASTLGAEVPAAFAHTNRLVLEKSPYLLQHAHNPVDWYPWGEAAFARARAEDKPIFLSIGYSTCHWCHVMERESFENAAIAQRLNADFICIKVDREERPDVDHVYMTFVQATTGGGGWPMSVWLTPDLKPFYGGSYFPPEPRFQLPGFPQLLRDIAEGWRNNRAGIVGRSEAVMTQLQAQANAGNADTNAVGAGVLTEGFQRLVKQFDSREGGFGGAPKFPRPVTLNFLLRVAAREGRESRTGRQALDMTVFTLRKMIAGGVHDQLGGGFHRYAVDEFWHVPHFEKMLYDQAQLTTACLDAWQFTHDPVFRETARDVLDYVARDLSDPAGGFYCAEDADSPIAAGRPERAEGAFYVWRAEDIQAALVHEAALFNFFYGIEEKGNAPAGSDPHREFTGKNILLQRHTLADAARKFKLPEAEAGRQLAADRQKLFALRALRPRPHRDDKILTAWNGLMISAAARAAQVLDNPADLERARRAAVFVRENLYRAETGTLLRSYRGGAGRVEGFVDDYAFLIQGLLDLYEASFDVAWLRWAEQLQDKQDALFWDTVNGAYFSAGGGDRTVLLRLKEDYDGAEPAPSSVAALNLLRLAQLTGRAELRARAGKIFVTFASELKRNPGSLPQLLVALDASLARPRQVVLAGEAAAPDTRALLRIVHSQYQPNKILLLADGGAGQAWLGERLEFLRTVKPIGGLATAYVCENYVCQLPTADTNEVARLLFGAGK